MAVSFGKCKGKMQSRLFSQLVWSGLLRKFLTAIKLVHQFVFMLKYYFSYPGDTISIRFWGYFGPKKSHKKINKIHKDF